MENIVKKPITELTAYKANARTHSAEQIAQIAASIKEWGWTIPILIDECGMIIAGHGRLAAAEYLQMKEVPCMVAEGWTEEQKRAYVLADNKLALNAGWDSELLRLEIDDLISASFDIGLIGFTDEELKALSFGDAQEIALPELKSGDKEPFQQITFTLSDEQAEQVKAAMDIAKSMGDFVDTGNENSNGNAIARVAELFLGQHGNG